MGGFLPLVGGFLPLHLTPCPLSETERGIEDGYITLSASERDVPTCRDWVR